MNGIVYAALLVALPLDSLIPRSGKGPVFYHVKPPIGPRDEETVDLLRAEVDAVVDARLAAILRASESLSARGHEPVTGDLDRVYCRRCGAFDVEAARGVPCSGSRMTGGR